MINLANWNERKKVRSPVKNTIESDDASDNKAKFEE